MDGEIIQHTPQASPQGIYYRKGQIIQMPAKDDQPGKMYVLTEKGWELIIEESLNG